MFTNEEIEEIRNIKLWDLIVNASSVTPEEIQRNVFFHLSDDVCPQPLQLNATRMEPCPYLQGYDYFRVRCSDKFFFVEFKNKLIENVSYTILFIIFCNI